MKHWADVSIVQKDKSMMPYFLCRRNLGRRMSVWKCAHGKIHLPSLVDPSCMGTGTVLIADAVVGRLAGSSAYD